MNLRFLLPAFALGSAALAQPPASAPLTFDIRMPEMTLPLRLQDPINLRKPQLSFSGDFVKAREPSPRSAPPKPAVRPSPVEMPIVSPDPTVAHAMNVIAPKPGIDYKIATIPEAPKAALAATTPEQR